MSEALINLVLAITGGVITGILLWWLEKRFKR